MLLHLLLLAGAAPALAAVTLTLDGAPATVGTFDFPSHHKLVVSNGLLTATFDRDDQSFTGMYPRPNPAHRPEAPANSP